MPQPADVTALLVQLQVADEMVLYLMLSEDGTMHRMGTGSEVNSERDLFVGQGDEFLAVKPHISASFFQWLGVYSDSHYQGKLCRLTIGFRLKDSSEVQSIWNYGTCSAGPPSELRDLVAAAVNITEPWYQQQKVFVRNK